MNAKWVNKDGYFGILATILDTAVLSLYFASDFVWYDEYIDSKTYTLIGLQFVKSSPRGRHVSLIVAFVKMTLSWYSWIREDKQL